jgi:replication factor C subunit 3/5
MSSSSEKLAVKSGQKQEMGQWVTPVRGQPLVEKYRPGTWDDVIGNEHTISTLHKFCDTKTVPHMLYCGPSGTGKTSTIMLLCREMYGDAREHMVLELNASTDRGIDVVRQKILDFATTENYLYKACGIKDPAHPYKMVILDEVDSMTNEAQATLRRLMEDSMENTRFCLICNFETKIDPAVQSRCIMFRFQPLDLDAISKRVDYIARKEGVEIDSKTVKTLNDLCRGDMRRIINTLQILSFRHKRIEEENVYNSFGIPSTSEISKLVETIRKDRVRGYSKTYELVKSRGYDLKNLVTGFYRYLRDLKMTDIEKCKMLMRLGDLELCLNNVESNRVHVACLAAIISDMKL